MKPISTAPWQISDFDAFEKDALPESRNQASAGPHALVCLAFDLVGRWYWLALGLIVGGLGGAHYLTKTPLKYTATAVLLIKQQTATVMSRDQVDAIDLRSVEAMNTVVAHIQNRAVLERVAGLEAIRSLPGLIPPPVDLLPPWLRRFQGPSTPPAESPPPPEELARVIRGWLGVSILRGTRLIHISTTHPVPAVAAALADAIASEYVALIASASTRDRSESIRLLESKAQEAQADLRATRSILATYARAIEACKALDLQEIQVVTLVVLDSAPFLAVSDTRIIAPLVHNFCVVVKADYVPKGAMRRVLEIMKGDGIPLSGIVFNSYRDCSYLKGQNYAYGYYRSAGYGSYSRYCYDSYGHA